MTRCVLASWVLTSWVAPSTVTRCVLTSWVTPVMVASCSGVKTWSPQTMSPPSVRTAALSKSR